MTETTPNKAELTTLDCPCGMHCCSDVVTSPNRSIVILFWDCKGVTDEQKTEDLDSLASVLNGEFDEDDDDETETS